ncbi:metallophosphoesterase family protein [Natronincola ferrireducens]|uniref:Phosphoesterase n=1 Tax=Natronincola ferrireducens TaxID=393762 RepID=A0A1G8Y810_9FIRM|nr:metallophosphoesterase family protein [Natronincola ferrireducens]SDJ99019.1 hypothetical protein SAMN05660472_00460 [Natronincola ferrireducens]
MKIGIISDTHITKDPEKFLHTIKYHFHGLDLIIHAGDFVAEGVVKGLIQYKDFVGVLGNVDNQNTTHFVKEKELIELEGYKIGIYHGHGIGKTTLERTYEIFMEDNVDIIIFGHSHQPIIKTHRGILMLNPGSPTQKRKERWFSYILLELDRESIEASLKLFSKRLE